MEVDLRTVVAVVVVVVAIGDSVHTQRKIEPFSFRQTMARKVY